MFVHVRGKSLSLLTPRRNGNKNKTDEVPHSYSYCQDFYVWLKNKF